MNHKVIEICYDKDPDTGEEGDFIEKIKFPANWEICYDCRGNGKTYLGWRSRDQPAFTMEDFHGEGPDFYHDYTAGNYDACCQGCGGSGKILQIDEEACEKDSRLKFMLEQHHQYLQGVEEDRRTRMSEMGLR